MFQMSSSAVFYVGTSGKSAFVGPVNNSRVYVISGRWNFDRRDRCAHGREMYGSHTKAFWGDRSAGAPVIAFEFSDPDC